MEFLLLVVVGTFEIMCLIWLVYIFRYINELDKEEDELDLGIDDPGNVVSNLTEDMSNIEASQLEDSGTIYSPFICRCNIYLQKEGT